jgi:hypothetical protein
MVSPREPTIGNLSVPVVSATIAETGTHFFTPTKRIRVSTTGTERTAAVPIATVRITPSVVSRWLSVSTVGFFVFAYGFASVNAALRGSSLESIVVTGSRVPVGGGDLLVAVGAVILVVAVHELLHGVFMARYGDDPTYGIGVTHFFLPYAYTRGDRGSYTQDQLLVVLLAPVGLITAAGLVAMALVPSPLWIVPLAANAAGSIGDLWMASVLWQYPPETCVGGHPESGSRGIAIYGPSDPTENLSRRPLATAIVVVVLSASVGMLTVIAIGLMALVFISLMVGSGTVVVEPNGWLLLRHVLRADGVVVLEIGGSALLSLALVGGVVWAMGSWLVGRGSSGPEP